MNSAQDENEVVIYGETPLFITMDLKTALEKNL